MDEYNVKRRWYIDCPECGTARITSERLQEPFNCEYCESKVDPEELISFFIEEYEITGECIPRASLGECREE